MCKRIVCFLLAACIAAAFAQNSESRPRLAVYVAGDKAENEKKVLNSEILNSLVRGGQFVGSGASNDFLAALAKEQGKQPRASDAQVRECAKKLGIERVCVVDIYAVFDTFYVALRVVNVETGEVDAVSSAYSGLRRFEDFTGVSGGVVEDIYIVGSGPAVEKPKRAAPSAPARQTAPAEAPPVSPPAFTQGKDEPAVNADYYYNKGHAGLQSGDHDGAIADYTQALKLDPKLVYALIARGAAYYSKGDYRSAVEDYSRSIELEPNDAGVFNSRGNAYRKMGDYDKAAADFEAALRIDPDNAEAKESLELINLDKSGASDGGGKGEHPQSMFEKYLGNTKYKELIEVLRSGGARFGSVAALSGQGLELNGSKFSGTCFSFGGAAAVPFKQLGELVATEFVTEFRYTYRSLSYDGPHRQVDIEVSEGGVSVPFLFKANTVKWERYGGYVESGVQFEFQYGTESRVDGKNMAITDRNTEFQFVFGVGGFFQLNDMTWYLGFRTTPSFGDFAESTKGGLSQNGVVLSVMF